MNVRTAVSILWREWATNEYADAEYDKFLFRQVKETHGRFWGALVLGVVATVWSAIMLLPFSLFCAWFITLGFDDPFMSRRIFWLFRIQIGAVASCAVGGVVAGYLISWEETFRSVAVALASLIATYIPAAIIAVLTIISGRYWTTGNGLVGEWVFFHIAYAILFVIVLTLYWTCMECPVGQYDVKTQCFWWKWPCRFRDVEQAIETLSDPEALILIRRLRSLEMTEDELAKAVADLTAEDWQERWLARQTCIRFGGLAIRQPKMKSLAITKHISLDTRRRLSSPRYLCADCYAFVTKQSIYNLRYFACRNCGRSHDMIAVPNTVALTLDKANSEAITLANGDVQVNWIASGVLSDCNRVEIINANDQDVESFSVAIGNRAERTRFRRFSSMTCVVHDRTIGANSLRILKTLFRRVRSNEQGSPTGAAAGV